MVQHSTSFAIKQRACHRSLPPYFTPCKGTISTLSVSFSGIHLYVCNMYCYFLIFISFRHYLFTCLSEEGSLRSPPFSAPTPHSCTPPNALAPSETA